MLISDVSSPINSDKVHIKVDDTVLTDLHSRLTNTRWPDELSNQNWEYGTNLHYLQELTDYWLHEYDWRKQEAWLNTFDHFKSNAAGINLHYIHQRSADDNAIPIVLLHGWPSNFIQLLKIIPLLTDPQAHGLYGVPSFHVVVPSLPGFGFSDAPSTAGMDMEKIASHISTLMTEVLGYKHYGARGSDLGGTVIDQLARHYPEQIIGVHLTGIIIAGGAVVPDNASLAEQKFILDCSTMAATDIAYARQHSSKPQTLAYGLHDSPTGLASWLLEKYYFWGDTRGDIESRFSKDFLLTMITSYWVTQTLNSSIRTYYDMVRNRGNTDRIEVPVGMLMSPYDLFPPAPREYAERLYNIVQWSDVKSGGHFLEWEEPGVVAHDIQRFFNNLL